MTAPDSIKLILHLWRGVSKVGDVSWHREKAELGIQVIRHISEWEPF